MLWHRRRSRHRRRRWYRLPAVMPIASCSSRMVRLRGALREGMRSVRVCMGVGVGVSVGVGVGVMWMVV